MGRGYSSIHRHTIGSSGQWVCFWTLLQCRGQGGVGVFGYTHALQVVGFRQYTAAL